MRMRKYAPFLILALASCGPCYNTLVSEEQGVESAWSQVENQPQRRADLIPNLVETVEGEGRPQGFVPVEAADAHERNPDRRRGVRRDPGRRVLAGHVARVHGLRRSLRPGGGPGGARGGRGDRDRGPQAGALRAGERRPSL